jgi:hypothetical protein
VPLCKRLMLEFILSATCLLATLKCCLHVQDGDAQR